MSENDIVKSDGDVARDLHGYVALISEARECYGRQAAKALWEVLPIPQVRRKRPDYPIGELKRFMEERLEGRKGARMEARVLYELYCDWCAGDWEPLIKRVVYVLVLHLMEGIPPSVASLRLEESEKSSTPICFDYVEKGAG